MPRLPTALFLLSVLLTGCGKQSGVSDRNLVLASDPAVTREIGDEKNRFLVVGSKALSDGLTSGRFAATDSRAAETATATAGGNSLVVGFPIGLVGEQEVFGGVITAVSDTQSTDLGDLKLSDLTPVHVITKVVNGDGDKPALALLGCLSECEETSPLVPLETIPIVAVDNQKGLLMLDLAAIGKDLNIMDALDPNGETTGMKTVSAKTVAMDYDLSTLVFDVEVHMVPKKTPSAAETVFNGRWYLRLASAFNPAFEARPAAPGVGFFMTERSVSPKIERQARPVSLDGTTATVGTIKYYVKNVPKAYQKAFAAAFDDWNDRFTKLTGSKIFDYEFVDASDPRSKLLVPGDVRYHIVEWDLVNHASYGGLGPSIANQETGEILSSNVLIQGPTIEKLYKAWFKLNQQVADLRAAGRTADADALYHDGSLELRKAIPKTYGRAGLRVRLGDQLEFRVGARTPALRDPLMERDDFDALPTGVSYDDYMFGYFREMVAHELGHNLGLRHNFRGNLGAKPGPVTEGSVSDSVMEYLGRDYRYDDDIGDYDLMAIKYAYLGTPPDKQGLYCTDEDSVSADSPTNSAECTPDDATNDPFSWYEARLSRAIDLLVARGSEDAPVWTVPDMNNELKVAIQGMGFYASSADVTGATWTNFFTGGDRPTSPAGVKAYVAKRLKAQLCDPALQALAKGKHSADAQKKVADNLTALRAKALELLAPLKVYQPTELACP